MRHITGCTVAGGMSGKTVAVCKLGAGASWAREGSPAAAVPAPREAAGAWAPPPTRSMRARMASSRSSRSLASFSLAAISRCSRERSSTACIQPRSSAHLSPCSTAGQVVGFVTLVSIMMPIAGACWVVYTSFKQVLTDLALGCCNHSKCRRPPYQRSAWQSIESPGGIDPERTAHRHASPGTAETAWNSSKQRRTCLAFCSAT